jgi:hypothetical protein
MQTEIRVKGKIVKVRSTQVQNRTVIVTGRWVRTASIADEDLVEGDIVAGSSVLISKLRIDRLKPDIFTFGQMFTDSAPRLNFYYEWDNLAAIRIASYNEWWERLPQETRKNVRRAAKRGVVIRVVEFTDELVKGVQEIYDETPVRQGRRFWHYGKDFETIKQELGTYLGRSQFIGAYLNEQLIGFMKLVYVDRVAMLIHILARNEHYDKRPMNALVANAVELCDQKRLSFFAYGKYIYDGKHDSPLTEFKRRNGFEEFRFPRYFIPLSIKGACALRLKLHLGVRRWIPRPVQAMLLKVRSRVYQLQYLSKHTDSVAGRTGMG